nr:MAG TPA: YonK protein [Caudoviricetes sp.]
MKKKFQLLLTTTLTITVTEFGKDDTKVYRLGDILRDWHNVEGVTFTIQQTEELPAMNDQEDDC